MPRLFTGIELPAAHRLRLSLLSAPLAGARWISQENMHLTLRFAGDIDERCADDWADQLAMIETGPLQLTIQGLGVFGGAHPRTVWAGFKPNCVLDQLQLAHERAARVVGLAPETRKFTPHITLARLRGGRPTDVANFLSANGTLVCEPFTPDRAVLFSARPGRGGGPYAIEDTYPLGDTQQDLAD